jgi:asparagine synthase (glutamine-hydrolysing)
MCGISGILCGDKVCINDIQIINKIVELQNNRGPDYSEIQIYSNSCILGHNRLKIIDLSSNGNQPMETDNFSIVFNGEIYNYLEIRDELKDKTNFVSNSDTEVLLKSFEIFGIDETLRKINGMFAIGLYDKNSDKLYLIRDRMGVKPLYYYHDTINNKLYFASNLKSIFYSLYEINKMTWKINYESIYKFLLLGGCWEGPSLVTDIYKLESATYLEITKNNCSLHIKKVQYWIPNYRTGNFEEILENSVKLRLHADVPISILFSGGIDSSILAYYSNNSNCVHLCNGETEYASIIANKLGVNLIPLDTKSKNIDSNKLYEYLKKYVDFSGEPSMACIIPMLTLDGVKNISTVVLSGNGGDELCYGYDRTPFIKKENMINKNLCSYIRNCNLSADPNVYTEEDYQLLHIFRHPESFTVHSVNQYSFDKFKQLIYNSFKIGDNLDKEAFYRFLEFSTYVKNDLNPTLDYASMYYGLEVRNPFLDYRLIELGLSISSEEHISNDTSSNFDFSRKYLLKKILSNKLEEGLYNKTKLGFSLPADLATEYNNVVGIDGLQKLLKRGIISIQNTKLGVSYRNISYLNASFCALEEWFVQYIDTGIIML